MLPEIEKHYPGYNTSLKNFRERTLFKNKPKINKDNTSLNFINEKFDVTDKISQTCFESEYDFKKFSNKIIRDRKSVV